MARRKKADAGRLEIPVAYSNVSIGDETCRIGVKIDRAHMTVTQADTALCGRRLTGSIVAGGNGDSPGQATLPGIPDVTLRGSFDVKSFSANGKRISAGLTFALKGFDMSDLAHFAKRTGKLIVEDVADLPEGEGGDDEE